jgi:hypothetical protein
MVMLTAMITRSMPGMVVALYLPIFTMSSIVGG